MKPEESKKVTEAIERRAAKAAREKKEIARISAVLTDLLDDDDDHDQAQVIGTLIKEATICEMTRILTRGDIYIENGFAIFSIPYYGEIFRKKLECKK